MTDGNRIHPQYRSMMEIPDRGQASNAVSATQAELLGMDPGARWSHEVSHRVYARGGNEGHFTDEALEPDGKPHPLGDEM